MAHVQPVPVGFVFGIDWNPAQHLPLGGLVVGTLITSGIALAIGVPVAVGTALFLNAVCQRRARAPLALLVHLLAAVPSVVYGLWGVFVLTPKRPVEKWLPPRSRSSRGWVAAGPRSTATSSPG